MLTSITVTGAYIIDEEPNHGRTEIHPVISIVESAPFNETYLLFIEIVFFDQVSMIDVVLIIDNYNLQYYSG